MERAALAEGLLPQTPGPKTDYRRTEQAIKLVVRCRSLDRDCSPAVIAQKIRQQHPDKGKVRGLA